MLLLKKNYKMKENKCEHVKTIRPNSMFYKGKNFSALYCEECNSIWDNPNDSMMEYAKNYSKKAKD